MMAATMHLDNGKRQGNRPSESVCGLSGWTLPVSSDRAKVICKRCLEEDK